MIWTHFEQHLEQFSPSFSHYSQSCLPSVTSQNMTLFLPAPGPLCVLFLLSERLMPVVHMTASFSLSCLLTC